MSMAIRKPEGLLLVKQLYEDARLLSDRDDSLSLSKAVIILDLSVEQMLNHIVLNLDPNLTVNMTKGSQEIDRRTLWGNASTALNKAQGARLTEAREMANLHALRNLVQHIGTDSAQSEVRRYVQATAIMFDNAFRDAYGLDFSNFRMWSFITNEDLRKWLQYFEQKLIDGNPLLCIAGCLIAHQRIVATVRQSTKGFSFHHHLSGSLERQLSEAIGYRETNNLLKELNDINGELTRSIDQLESEVVAIGVGIPVMDTRRFLQGGQGIAMGYYGGLRIDIVDIGGRESPEKEKETASFMLNYLSRFIRLIEEGYTGALDKLKLDLDT